MEESILPESLCSQCSTAISEETKFCTNCGYPEKGTEKEQATYHAQKIMKKSKAKDDKKRIESARNTLYWIAGIFFVSGIFLFAISQDNAILVTNIIIAIIYLILAYFSKEKPFATLLSGLLLYILIITLNAIFDPSTLFSGIIIKIIILSFLIKGVYSASQNSEE